MTVVIKHISSGSVTTLKGEPEEVRHQALILFPWAHRKPYPQHHHDPNDIKDVISRLAGAQDLLVEVEA